MEEPRRFIQVVTGPRQVGKSTVVRQVLKDIDTVWQLFSADAVPASDGAWISNCWSAVRSLKKAKGLTSVIIVIDEIQKIRNWSEVVKKEWDADTFNGLDIRVLLLGSSRVLIERGLSESLAGRFEEIRMSHWGYEEMRQCFGFTPEQYIYFGGYPGAAPLVDDEDRHRQYIQSAIIDASINNDILMDTPIGKPALLRQTFELCAAYSGHLLSLNKMLGALQDAGNTSTLAAYINLLRDSGLLRALHKYSIDTARRKASVPKLQVYDNALTTAYSPLTFTQAVADRRAWGHLVESAVGAYIVNQAFVKRFDVYYWRERNWEVDFILRRHGTTVAVEVKSGGETSSAGLTRFCDLYHPTQAFIVGDGGVPLSEFLCMDICRLF